LNKGEFQNAIKLDIEQMTSNTPVVTEMNPNHHSVANEMNPNRLSMTKNDAPSNAVSKLLMGKPVTSFYGNQE